MNLLIFIHSLSSGGAERVTTNLANHWASRGWQVTIVTLASKELDFYQLHPAIQRIALDRAADSSNPLAAVVNNLRRVQALRKELKRIRPDVALAMMTTANILLALAARGMPNIASIGSERTYPAQLPLGRVWEKLRATLYGRLTAVVALTAECAEWLKRYTNARHIPVIPNAVHWPLPAQEPCIALPATYHRHRILLAVGRLSKEKQFDLLIRAFGKLAGDFPDWILVVLGEGPDRKALEIQVREAGLQDRVLLPGRAGNVGEWYERADLYVMSSRFEGFPNTLVEAMAHGLPAVSFDCDTGPRDIIRHEVDGLLVSPNDETGLERALHSLMSDKALRENFGLRAIDVRNRFSMERIVALWEECLSDKDRANKNTIDTGNFAQSTSN